MSKFSKNDQANAPADDSEHLTQAELAKWLRCSTRTLQRLHSTGDGPPAIQLSDRRLIFPVSDARSWLATRTKGVKIETKSRRPIARKSGVT